MDKVAMASVNSDTFFAISTKRGHDEIIFKSYRFEFKRENKNESYVRLRTNKLCKSSVKTTERSIVKTTSIKPDGSHEYDHEAKIFFNVYLCIQSIKQSVEEEPNVPVSTLYEEEVNIFRRKNGNVGAVPVFSLVKSFLFPSLFDSTLRVLFLTNYGKNIKAIHDALVTDFSRIVVKENDGETNSTILHRWAACNRCIAVYRSHSKKDKDSFRENYGLSSRYAHLNECKKRVVAKKTTSFVKQIQIRILTFPFNKSKLNARLAEKLTEAEPKFIAAGAHWFQSLKDDDFIELIQTAIDIGGQVWKLSACDILYGRKSIRQEAI